MTLTRLVFSFSLLILMACATTPQNFYQNPNAASNESLCRAYQNSYYTNYRYAVDVYHELSRRGLNLNSCQSLVSAQNTKIAVGLVAAGAVAYGLSQIKNNGGGGGGWNGGADWDQFHDDYGNLIWRCREISSGRFTENSNCSGSLRTDSRWPQK